MYRVYIKDAFIYKQTDNNKTKERKKERKYNGKVAA